MGVPVLALRLNKLLVQILNLEPDRPRAPVRLAFSPLGDFHSLRSDAMGPSHFTGWFWGLTKVETSVLGPAHDRHPIKAVPFHVEHFRT